MIEPIHNIYYLLVDLIKIGLTWGQNIVQGIFANIQALKLLGNNIEIFHRIFNLYLPSQLFGAVGVIFAIAIFYRVYFGGD